MNQKNVIREIKDNICCLTINRPKHLNALNKNTIKELGLEIINAQKDKSTRCIIITGSENKAFVAGADIKEFISFNKTEGEKLARKGQEELFDVIENSSIPVIAAQWFCTRGLELAMSCYIRVASEMQKWGCQKAFGVIPGYGDSACETLLVRERFE